MGTVEEDTLNQQRQRRKRINRMKKMIVYTIAIWMIGSLTAIIILSVQMVRLNDKVKKLGEISPVVESSEKTSSSEQNHSVEDKNDSFIANGIDTTDNIASEGDTHKVYLTFDGEISDQTSEILDVLARYQIKATFFVDGNQTEEAQEIMKRIVEEGHTLGMNSYSKTFSSIYNSTEAFSQDYNLIHGYLLEVTGIDCKYYRFPGGSSNTITNVNMTEFAKVLNEKGVTYFDWNVSAGDASNDYTSEDVVNNVLAGISEYKTSVVLLHEGDGKNATLEALPTLIEALQEQEAELLPIDEQTKVIQYLKQESID